MPATTSSHGSRCVSHLLRRSEVSCRIVRDGRCAFVCKGRESSYSNPLPRADSCRSIRSLADLQTMLLDRQAFSLIQIVRQPVPTQQVQSPRQVPLIRRQRFQSERAVAVTANRRSCSPLNFPIAAPRDDRDLKWRACEDAVRFRCLLEPVHADETRRRQPGPSTCREIRGVSAA